MNSETFRSRVSALIKKSRKALRLYSSMGRLQSHEHSELSEMQIREWQEVNSELSEQLSSALESRYTRRLASNVFLLRDRFYSRWRETEAEAHLKQRELISASEKGEFIKATLLGRELVVLKARKQACQAAHNELQELIERSKLTPPQVQHQEDSGKQQKDKGKPVKSAVVIPLRRKDGSS
ncbi:MAG: hypothetical protein D6719_02550 [Candidatus Dadabacteria bacterium]|nr:MAG: hypothetical protein D6719_02550 [Candidatus Dadabacteria bacterium]